MEITFTNVKVNKMESGDYMSNNHTRIRPHRLIRDGMVLQRNTRVKIWGWAPAEEVIIVRFQGDTFRTNANRDGEWMVSFNTGDAGGLYEMVIENGDGTERIVVRNILLGDVWVCSGQSNMAVSMNMVRNLYEEEIARADYDAIRHFLVMPRCDFATPQKDLDTGTWISADSQHVVNFSAVGFFFAKKLYEEYHVPIGLINASMGGAPAEAFISEESLSAFPKYLDWAKKLSDKSFMEAIIKDDQEHAKKWYQYVNQHDTGIPENSLPCYDTEYDASDWPTINVPSRWVDEGLGDFNGVVWYRKEFDIPASILGKPAKLFLGHVVDEDTTYINGKQVGSIASQYAPRIYDIPDGVLKEGKNIIVVRVISPNSKGGFYAGKPYCLKIGDQVIDLSGKWQYMIGVKHEKMRKLFWDLTQPLGLYNGMIAPLINYAIKGVIWYQGETNSERPADYEELFKTLIRDWRVKWGQGDFPFLYVQLPNYDSRYGNGAGNWPIIREAQRKTLELPATGMAVTLDVGEWNDIHPRNKKDVGIRLALFAQKIAYGDNSVVASGPLYKSAERAGNRIKLFFDYTGSGLMAKDGDRLEYFEIAGEDKKFIRANAAIEGDCVVVWSDEVMEPVYVRYAWDDNPEGANLYNLEGLPASPFTTE